MELKTKILIVDDSEINQNMLTAILGDKYDYIYANDGLQAVDALENDLDIDLMLLDINKSELDGFRVLDIMNRRKWIDEIPVIIISAEGDSGFIQRCCDLGVTDYINLPFNSVVVRRRVSNTLMLYARQKRLVQLVRSQVFERERANSIMVNIFSQVIESHNSESGLHLLHVRMLTELLLRELVRQTDKYPLSEWDISMITTLSALHDIGKISVPKDIINKPGPLTPEEFEIMKRHPVAADELLDEVMADRDDPLMQKVREICRWHHERWDGRGYPDGLCGDEIPISAQVVSLADVYDALTSERCYKKAYSHETAMRMILNGECGAFNPLLLSCFRAVSDVLEAEMKQSPEDFDFQFEAKRLTAEMFSQQNIPGIDRAANLLAAERSKKDFFARLCGGLQFEYDSFQRKAVLTDWDSGVETKQKIINLSEGDKFDILSEEDLDRVISAIASCTRKTPEAELDVTTREGCLLNRRRLRLQPIWTGDGAAFTGIVGQFTSAEDVPLPALDPARSRHIEQFRAAINGMRGIFEAVRLVNPDTCRVLQLGEDGTLTETGEHCYDIWGKERRCENCTSLHAAGKKNWSSKLEFLNSSPHFVFSHYEKSLGDSCILELVASLNTDCTNDSENSSKFGSNMLMFYRDSLTNAYTRLYLDNFAPELENADAVALLDVNKLKQINDTYGHPVGDEALRIISETILSCIRSNDTLIRYGGDEFLLIFANISEDVFHRRLKQISKAISGKTVSGHPEIQLGVSIGGVYHVHPLAEAIRQADMKMYEKKA